MRSGAHAAMGGAIAQPPHLGGNCGAAGGDEGLALALAASSSNMDYHERQVDTEEEGKDDGEGNPETVRQELLLSLEADHQVHGTDEGAKHPDQAVKRRLAVSF